MSTSNSTNYTLTRNDIILQAFAKIEKYSVGKSISPDDVAIANTTLNLMLKSWEAKMPLTHQSEGILFLEQYQGSYEIGASAVHACAEDDLVLTQLSSAHAISSTTLLVDSTTGMTIGDYIGIVLTDLSLYWTTIANIPTSTSLTINVGLSGAASSGGVVYTYTTNLEKPLLIISSRLRRGVDNGATSTEFDFNMMKVSYEEYHDLPMKSVNSTPNQFSSLPKRTTYSMYIYPRPADTSQRIHFTYFRKIQDMNSSTDELDLAQEWVETTIYQLAIRLAPDFGKSKMIQDEVKPTAEALLQNMMNWNVENTSVRIVPDDTEFYD